MRNGTKLLAAKYMKTFIASSGLLLCASLLLAKPSVVVKTAEGPVNGLFKNGVYEFLGIPYAAPPVGKLRWMPPQPAAKWKEPIDATHFGNICAQITTLGVFAGPASVDEDCLYLNVFTPKLGNGDQPGPGTLPVIV